MVLATVSSSPGASRKGLSDVTSNALYNKKDESRQPIEDDDDASDGYADFLAFLSTPPGSANNSPDTPSEKKDISKKDPIKVVTVQEPVIEAKAVVVEEAKVVQIERKKTDDTLDADFKAMLAAPSPKAKDLERKSTAVTQAASWDEESRGTDARATVHIGDINAAGESKEVAVKSDWSKAAAAAPPVPAPKETAPVATSGAMTVKEESKPAARPTAALSNSKLAHPSLRAIPSMSTRDLTPAEEGAAQHLSEEAPAAIAYFTLKAAQDQVDNERSARQLAKDNMSDAHAYFDKLDHDEKVKRAAEIEELISAPRPAAVEYFTAMDMEKKAKLKAQMEGELQEPAPAAVEYFTQKAAAEKERKAAEIQALKENPPPASIATEYFNKKEEERQEELKKQMAEPAPAAIEYFTRKAEEEERQAKETLKRLEEKTPEASVATAHFARQKSVKAEQMEAARAETRAKDPVEALPVDHFTKLGEQETARKAREAWDRAEAEMPIAVYKFTKLAEEEKARKAEEVRLLSESEASVATRYFARKAEEEAERSVGQEAEVMPAAIQHFTMADRAEKARQKAAIEEMKENPPPMAPGQEYFTTRDRAEKEKKAAEIAAMKENPPPASVATEYFNKRESQRKLEIEAMAKEPAPAAIEYFTKKAEEEERKAKETLKRLEEKTPEASAATAHFANLEKRKAEDIEAAKAETRAKAPMEPVPVDYFTKMGERETAERHAEAKALADAHMPVATRKFTEAAERERSTRSMEVNNPDMSVATKHFMELELEKEAERAAKAETEIMPAAIQKFTMEAMEERERKKAALERMKDEPAPVPPGVAHFTPGLEEQ